MRMARNVLPQIRQHATTAEGGPSLARGGDPEAAAVTSGVEGRALIAGRSSGPMIRRPPAGHDASPEPGSLRDPGAEGVPLGVGHTDVFPRNSAIISIRQCKRNRRFVDLGLFRDESDLAFGKF